MGAKYSYAWAKNSENGSAIGVGGRYTMALGSTLFPCVWLLCTFGTLFW
nr:YfaZ family outer membrane protein [Shewanella benthica]